MSVENALAIEVVFAFSDEQIVVPLSVPAGTTVLEAVVRSGLSERYRALDGQQLRLGVHGRAVRSDALVCDGDRIEIYRPLLAEPKQARRRRAARRL